MMDFTVTKVKDIMQKKFWKVILQDVAAHARQLEADDVNDAFNYGAEMFELDGIDTINVDTVETETNTDNSQIVFGQMTLNVLLKGFCVNNGEKQHNGNFPLTMIYTYTFDYYRGKYENLYLEYVD